MHAAITDRGRGPQIAGTRITVYDIMDYLKMGWHHTAIAAWLRLSSYQVQAAIDYISAHREEVEAAYQKMLERDARGNPPEIEAKVAVSRAKLRALLAARHAKHGSQEDNGASNPGRSE